MPSQVLFKSPSRYPLPRADLLGGSALLDAAPSPPSGPGYTWLQNAPTGELGLLTTNYFPGTLTPTGWGYNARSSRVLYVEDATKPFQGVLGVGCGEWQYDVGMGQGLNDPGALAPSGAVSGRTIRDIYACYLVKHVGPVGGGDFVEQDPGTKFSHFTQQTTNNFISKSTQMPAWWEAHGQGGGQWGIASTGWDGGPNGPPAWGVARFNDIINRVPPYDIWDGRVPSFCNLLAGWAENNVQQRNQIYTGPGAVKTDGTWQMIEVRMTYSTTETSEDGRVRLWVDGVAVADYPGLNFPGGASGSYSLPVDTAGTYGGGSRTVAAAQSFRIGGKAVYIDDI
jgi:hypothetical protein